MRWVNFMPAPEALREPTIADHRQRERRRLAADRHERRRIVDHLQPRRIAGFAQGHERDAELLRRRDLALRIVARANLRRAAGAAAPRQRRQRLERGARAAEMIDQGAKRARADIRAADKAEPVEALLVGQTDTLSDLVHTAPTLT